MRLIDADKLIHDIEHYHLSDGKFQHWVEIQPTVEPERLTDDDFETIRIHLNAQKEKLCNQQRWEEAEEYQRIIARFMAFASAEPEIKTDGDTISRQVAIDAMVNELSYLPITTEKAYGIAEVLNDLPSAELEITRCKDCKHKPSGDATEHDITFPDNKCPCQCEDFWYSWIPSDNWYCGYAERREE